MGFTLWVCQNSYWTWLFDIGFSYGKWCFSIVMLNYQMVNLHFPLVFWWFSYGLPHFLLIIMGFPRVFLWLSFSTTSNPGRKTFWDSCSKGRSLYCVAVQCSCSHTWMKVSYDWLVVSIPLKNMKVNWDDEIPNIWRKKKCSKPPTRWIYIYILNYNYTLHII